jgi:hypothetical protein
MFKSEANRWPTFRRDFRRFLVLWFVSKLTWPLLLCIPKQRNVRMNSEGGGALAKSGFCKEKHYTEYSGDVQHLMKENRLDDA